MLVSYLHYEKAIETLNYEEDPFKVLEKIHRARWDITNFSEAKYRLVNECLSFIKKLSESFLPLATRKVRMILKVFESSP